MSGRLRTGAGASGARRYRASAPRVMVRLAVALSLLVCVENAVGAQALGERVGGLELGEVLERYNQAIRRALNSVEGLTVEQNMLEPRGDGTFRTARALLTYTSEAGLEREILECELRYMFGTYTLESLVGPLIDSTEYEVTLDGREQMDGHDCQRLRLRALMRDADHFDGTVWVSESSPGPVRIVGEVADPPFPTTEIKLDKAFELQPCGLWMVRRHTGEVEASLFGRRRGVRHIFYDDYDIRLKEE